MVRTQIYLKERQYRELKLRAEKLNVPISELIRKGVELVLVENEMIRNENDPLLKMIGKIDGNKTDSDDIDKVIYA